jgi:hypothetical protein
VEAVRPEPRVQNAFLFFFFKPCRGDLSFRKSGRAFSALRKKKREMTDALFPGFAAVRLRPGYLRPPLQGKEAIADSPSSEEKVRSARRCQILKVDSP